MVTGADGKGRSAGSPRVRLVPLLAGWWPPREVKPAVWTHAVHRITLAVPQTKNHCHDNCGVPELRDYSETLSRELYL